MIDGVDYQTRNIAILWVVDALLFESVESVSTTTTKIKPNHEILSILRPFQFQWVSVGLGSLKFCVAEIVTRSPKIHHPPSIMELLLGGGLRPKERWIFVIPQRFLCSCNPRATCLCLPPPPWWNATGEGYQEDADRVETKKHFHFSFLYEAVPFTWLDSFGSTGRKG